MSTHEISAALKLLSSSSEKHNYNALVTIRTKLMKTKYGDKQLRAKGVIEKLLVILNKQDVSQNKNKVTDITLSILGNFCMEEEARNDVLNVPYGVYCICNFVIESPCSSIQNRGARTLANLALSSKCIVKILQTDVLPKLVKLLSEAKTKESQITYCRALRLISSSNNGKEQLIEENGVFVVSKLMSNEEEDVMKNSLRTVAELSVSGCSYRFARQILAAGIIHVMVEQIQNSDNTISHNALSTIIRLADFDYIRPVIGSAGGINLFIKLLSDERQHIDKIKVMNVLCLCGKESVNRVKIRENGVLEILLSALEDDKFKRLHDRIISSFLSYLYDELSLNLLLENRVVDVLLKHLQRCSGFMSDTVVISFNDDVFQIQESVATDGEESKEETSLTPSKLRPKKVAKRSKGKSLKKKSTESNERVSEPLPCSLAENESNSTNVSEVTTDVSTSSVVTESGGQDVDIVPATRSNYVYSLDSPTYENHSWEPSSIRAGITCKQSFSPVASGSGSGSLSPYSPLSHDSYYSPSVSSPTYSIPSPSSPDQPYSTVWSQPYHRDNNGDQSPSSSGSMLIGADGSPSASPWTFSSSEDDDTTNTIDDDSNNATDVDISDRGHLSALTPLSIKHNVVESTSETVAEGERGETMLESDESDEMSTVSDVCSNLSLNEKSDFKGPMDIKIQNLDKVQKRTRSQSNSESDVNPKRTKTSKEQNSTSKITESNILILMSRFSVKNDPSKYLVTPSVLSCLLDYIGEVSGAQSRAVRTLSRILRNPLCLNTLLNIGAPAIIYEKLILNKEGIDCSDVRSLLIKPKPRQSFDSTSRWSSPFSSPRHSCSDFSPDTHNRRWNFPTDPSSPTSSNKTLDYSVESPHFQREEKEEPPIDAQQTGLELLRDLSFTAESPFGQGAITHILLRKTKAERLTCCLSLHFLCWSSSMQDHFLVKHFALKSLSDVIQSNINHLMLPHIVNGFSFLSRMSSVKRKLTKDHKVAFPTIKSKHSVNDDNTCLYTKNNHDVFFLVGDEQLGGNREILVKRSPVFAAMLEGHYCESNQSVIEIQDTSFEAFRFILHYFHGCGLFCVVISSPLEDNQQLEFWENTLTLADRYLCQMLTDYLIWVVASTYLTSDLYFHIFMYSAFHNFTSLTNECVRMLFSCEQPVKTKAGIIKNIVRNNGAELLCNGIRTVFFEYIGKNFM